MSDVEQQKETINWYQLGLSFVSLNWLDGSINFVFRLVAKLSEVFLAIGIVVSAADFLLDGKLMQNNPLLSGVWAWTQAVAIESSSGVVLLYAVEAYRDKDYIKCGLYAALALGLALVGGVMLLTQLVLKTTGINWENSGNLYFVIGMAIARSLVSIAYIVMCRVKHISFAKIDSQVDSPPEIVQPEIAINSAINSALSTALIDITSQLDDMLNQRLNITVEKVTRTVIQEVTQAKLISISQEPVSKTSNVVDSKTSNIDRLSITKKALIANPAIKDQELADLIQASSITTARSWKKKAIAAMELHK